MTFGEKLFGGKKKLEKQLDEAFSKFARNLCNLKTNFDGEQSEQWRQATEAMRNFILISETTSDEDKLKALNDINAQLDIQIDDQRLGRPVNAERLSSLKTIMLDLANPDVDESTKRIHTLQLEVLNGKYAYCKDGKAIDAILSCISEFRSAYARARDRKQAKMSLDIVCNSISFGAMADTVINDIKAETSKLQNESVRTVQEIVKDTEVKDISDFITQVPHALSEFNGEISSMENAVKAAKAQMDKIAGTALDAREIGDEDEVSRLQDEFEALQIDVDGKEEIISNDRILKTQLQELKNGLQVLFNRGVFNSDGQMVRELKTHINGKTLGYILKNYDRIIESIKLLKAATEPKKPVHETPTKTTSHNSAFEKRIQELAKAKNMDEEFGEKPTVFTEKTVKDSETNV